MLTRQEEMMVRELKEYESIYNSENGIYDEPCCEDAAPCKRCSSGEHFDEPKCKICGDIDAWYSGLCYQCALESGEHEFVKGGEL